jgi:hypothetical protein
VDELLHYEEFPIELDRDRTYTQHKLRGQKPHGLWVSVRGEDDWESWCRAEEFHLNGLKCVHRVTLRRDANVLWLRTPEEIVRFHMAWSYETEFEREFAAKYGDRSYMSERFQRNQWPVDWDKVAENWSGIIIAPYQWSLRYDGPFWYYGMDCQSGCIWDMRAIETFELAEVNTHEEEMEKEDAQDR